MLLSPPWFNLFLFGNRAFQKNLIITLIGLFENELGPGVLQLTVQSNMHAVRKLTAQGVGH